MKRRIYLYLLLAAISLCSMAQNVGETMFVYRNNGQINGFIPEEIESIEYSNIDANGMEYNEIVIQVVNTVDSIYRIPLAEIDSISFYTPKTVYQPGTINLSDHLMPYVISCEDLSITFDSLTPADIMPRVGDKLVTTEMNDKFPVGFAGEVISINGTQVFCQKVSLEDVFETYYSVSSTYGYQGNDTNAKCYASRIAKVERDFKLGTWTKYLNIGPEVKLNSNLALSGITQYSESIHPSFHVNSTLVINKKEGLYLNVCIIGDITIQETLSIYGDISYNKDFLDKEFKVPVAPYTFFYFKPGLFINASATASFKDVWTQQFKPVIAFDFSSKNNSVIKPICKGNMVSSTFDTEGTIEGRVAFGGFIEVGLTFVSSDIDNVSLRGELGVEMVGNAVLHKSDITNAVKDTKVYERFRNSSIEVNAFCNLYGQAKLGHWGVQKSLPWDFHANLYTWDIVPTFENTTFEQLRDAPTSADASIDMFSNNNGCFFPVSVGLSVRDANNTEIEAIYASSKYSNGRRRLSYTFEGLQADANFTLYPKVKVFGIEMLASPASLQEKWEYPVKITNFEQTHSYHLENGYFIGNDTYSYKFDCAVAVELLNNKNVADWGYVYESPDGELKYISLKSYSSPYTDTRYSYYRNESTSTIRLYEFVKYTDNNNYYYGEPKEYELTLESEYSCPDENHPHMIDLGLPSGTKWACCNVGASTPDDHGEYYAWGETSQKSSKYYGEENYKYCTGNGSVGYRYDPLYANIAETQYDVAKVQWGSTWRMPTSVQLKELKNKCEIKWTTIKKKKGLLFTGPNGNAIFLPASGQRGHFDEAFVGEAGFYWSSTRGNSSTSQAIGYGFDKNNSIIEEWIRYLGYSVRAISQ